MEADVPDLTTLPRLLLRNARELQDRPAIREKDRGIWQTWSWRQYHDQVRNFALGLAALGFRRGDRLSVIGDNRPRLYAAQLAVQSLGGVSVAVYQDSVLVCRSVLGEHRHRTKYRKNGDPTKYSQAHAVSLRSSVLDRVG